MLLPLALAGCSGVLTSDKSAKQYYMLQPTELGDGNAADAAPTLYLQVGAVPGLDTDRILVLEPDAQLNRYANARWPDHLPEVLGSVLRRSLASSGRFSAVYAGGGAAPAWSLRLEAQQFYAVRLSSGSPVSVSVQLAGTIDCGDVSAAVMLSDRQSVSEERLSTVVAAHQAALDSVSRQLLRIIDATCS
jgi:ABC-type uncharacterized transport system auxiliary subunit